MVVKRKKKRRLASAKKRAEAHSQGYQRTTTHMPEGISYFQLKNSGMKRIDVLPYMVKVSNRFADAGELHYEKTFHVHRIGPNGDAYICPKRTSNERCPICEEVDRMKADPNASEDLVKSLRPKERQLFYVIDHDEPEKGAQLWDISFWLFGKQLDARIKNSEEEDGFDLFFDPGDEGFTLRLGIGERSFAGRAFYEVETIDFKARKKAIDPAIYEELPSLDDVIKVEKFDKLKSIFLQTSDAEEEEEEEEVPFESKKVNDIKVDETAKSLGMEDEEEDWDDDEEDWDDDDE